MNVIEKKQNEKRMLRYQYTARMHYNRSETLNRIVWSCCIVAWLLIFLPHNSNLGEYLIAVTFLFNILAWILNRRLTINVFLASALRKYFDAYVFGFSENQFTDPEVQKLEELSIRAVKHSPEKSKEQMANTGRDNPPGVMNWYEFSQPLSEQDAIFECQKQNCWWNSRITRKRLIFTGIELSIIIPFTILLIIGTKTNAGILQVIFSSGGLIIKCAERLLVNGRYYMLSQKIDGALDIITSSRTYENLKNLQSKIDTRRSLPVLEKNHIHKRNAKEYSELYHEATRLLK